MKRTRTVFAVVLWTCGFVNLLHLLKELLNCKFVISFEQFRKGGRTILIEIRHLIREDKRRIFLLTVDVIIILSEILF